MERSLDIKRKAFTNFIDGCKPDADKRAEILAALVPLAKDPNIGYRVLFVYPPFFQLRIPPYAANYVFDGHSVTVLYIGIIGQCP